MFISTLIILQLQLKQKNVFSAKNRSNRLIVLKLRRTHIKNAHSHLMKLVWLHDTITQEPVNPFRGGRLFLAAKRKKNPIFFQFGPYL
jgi:hypothetical protein